MQIIYFQFKEFYVPSMTLQSIGFKFFAKIKEVVFFVVQVALTLQATLNTLNHTLIPFVTIVVSWKPHLTNSSTAFSLKLSAKSRIRIIEFYKNMVVMSSKRSLLKYKF